LTKYYVKWQLNPNIFIEDPEARAKGWLQMLQMVKENMKAGKTLDWGNCSDGSGGYAIMEASSEAALFAEILKWTPYVSFDARPVISVDETIKTIQKMAS
jgi:hypothetical protein